MLKSPNHPFRQTYVIILSNKGINKDSKHYTLLPVFIGTSVKRAGYFSMKNELNSYDSKWSHNHLFFKDYVLCSIVLLLRYELIHWTISKASQLRSVCKWTLWYVILGSSTDCFGFLNLRLNYFCVYADQSSGLVTCLYTPGVHASCGSIGSHIFPSLCSFSYNHCIRSVPLRLQFIRPL